MDELLDSARLCLASGFTALLCVILPLSYQPHNTSTLRVPTIPLSAAPICTSHRHCPRVGDSWVLLAMTTFGNIGSTQMDQDILFGNVTRIQFSGSTTIELTAVCANTQRISVRDGERCHCGITGVQV